MTLQLRRKRPTTAPSTAAAKSTSALLCATMLVAGWMSPAVASDGASLGHIDRSAAAPRNALASAAEPKLNWRPYRPQNAPDALADQGADKPSSSKASSGKSAKDNDVKQAAAAAGECDAKGNVEQCAAQGKPVSAQAKSRLTKSNKSKPTLAKVGHAKNQPTLAKANRPGTAKKSGVVPAAMQDDDPSIDPFGDNTNRPGRRDVDENLEEEPTTTTIPDETETTTMPDETESPDLTPSTPRELTPAEEFPSRTEMNTPEGEPTPAGLSCEQDKEVCKQDFLALKANVISRIDLDIAIAGVEGEAFPCECSPSGLSIFEPRNWCKTVYTWKASGLCHKPLYFEDVHLERYGHAWNPVVQPFLSGAHFFVTVPLLPYKMGMNPPNECIYTLGYYRPGNCAPYLIDPIPLSLRGGIYQAAVVTGAFYIFP